VTSQDLTHCRAVDNIVSQQQQALDDVAQLALVARL